MWATHTQARSTQPHEREKSARCSFRPSFCLSPARRQSDARLRLTPGGCRRIQTRSRGAVAWRCVWCDWLLLAVPETKAPCAHPPPLPRVCCFPQRLAQHLPGAPTLRLGCSCAPCGPPGQFGGREREFRLPPLVRRPSTARVCDATWQLVLTVVCCFCVSCPVRHAAPVTMASAKPNALISVFDKTGLVDLGKVSAVRATCMSNVTSVDASALSAAPTGAARPGL